MLGQVERWLETFMCKQYADTFEAYGFKTLQSVCQLQAPQLQAMGIAQDHCKLVLERVHALRQTLAGQTNPYTKETAGSYDNSDLAPKGQQAYPGRDGEPMVRMQGNMPGYIRGNNEGFTNAGAIMMSQQQTFARHAYMQQQQHQQLVNTPYNSQPHGAPSYQNQMQCQGDVGPYTNVPGNKQNPYQGHDSALTINPPPMHPPHTHSDLNAGQNPQQVADNILHMAVSSYMPQHTVQVPLSANRSVPYHVPPRSPQYKTGQGQFPQQELQHVDQAAGMAQGSRQFVFPSNSPHQQHSRMSPISPGPAVMQSPQSHHSLSNCSPAGSIHSPGPASVRSPMSDTSTLALKSPSCMMQNSHQITQSPGKPYHIRSPVPMSQQLLVSVPFSIPPSHQFNISPADSHHSHHSNQFSPHDDLFSNISPYTPASKTSIHSPNQIYSHQATHAVFSTNKGSPVDSGCTTGGSNSSSSPLRSLHRLCMLPETSVVDPKSVINDSCDTIHTIDPPENCDKNTDNKTSNSKSSSSASSTQFQCIDGRNCSPKPNNNVCVIKQNVHYISDTLQRPESTDYPSLAEVKCQPKKLMLLRAAQDVKEQNEKVICVASKGTSEHTEMLTFKGADNTVLNKTEQTVNNPEGETKHSPIIAGDDENNDHVTNFTAGISDSDDDSQLLVRKDTKNSYGKHEISTRIRSQSTGSFSDELGSSDIDFEDHIGCDDITNDLSDMSDNHYDDGIAMDGDMLTEVSNSLVEELEEAVIVTEMNGKSKISSPHWKKSKLNIIQNVEQNINDDKATHRKTPQTLINRALKQSTGNNKISEGKNDRKKLLSGMEKNSDEDSDACAYIPGEVGSLCVDNGNGTMSIASRVNHSRQRKAPLKFEDASFIQGDFIFEDEEVYEPKIKSKKTQAEHKHNTNTETTEKCKIDNGFSVQQNVKVSRLQLEEVVDKHTIVQKQKEPQPNDVKSNPKSDTINEKYLNKNDTMYLRREKSDRKCSKSLIHGSVVSNSGCTNIETYPKAKHKNHIALQSYKKELNKPQTSKLSDCDKGPMVNRQCGSNSPDKGTITDAKDTKRVRNDVKRENRELGPKTASTCDRSSDIRLTKTEVTSVIVSDGAKISVNDKCTKLPENSKIEKNVICAIKNEIESDNGDEVVTIDLTHRDDMQENDNCDSNDVDSVLVVSKETHEEVTCKLERSSARTRKQDRKRKTEKIDKISNEMKTKKKLKQKRKGLDVDCDFELESKRNSLQSSNLNKTQEVIESKNKRVRDRYSNFKGPMIRLEGSKTSPTKCIVMNQPLDECDTRKKGAKFLLQSVATTLQISHLPSDKSVLVPHSDAEEGTMWLCALCGKHSSYKFLGDLFGPYSVETPEEVNVHSSSKCQRKQKSDEHSQPVTSSGLYRRPNRRGCSLPEETERWKEVWVHESCAVWADGVFLIGTKIYGLQEAVAVACYMSCTICRETGAMIGCLHKGCQQKFHHACAVDKDCFVDEENFSLLCPKHKVRKLKQQADTSMSTIS